jgi:hypothetical protein
MDLGPSAERMDVSRDALDQRPLPPHHRAASVGTEVGQHDTWNLEASVDADRHRDGPCGRGRVRNRPRPGELEREERQDGAARGALDEGRERADPGTIDACNQSAATQAGQRENTKDTVVAGGGTLYGLSADKKHDARYRECLRGMHAVARPTWHDDEQEGLSQARRRQSGRRPASKRGEPGCRRSGRRRQEAASASAREAQSTRKQFAKTGAKAIQGHIRARGQRQQARRDSR